MTYTRTIALLCLAGLLVKGMFDLTQGIDPTTHAIPTVLAAAIVCIPCAAIVDLISYLRWKKAMSDWLGPG